MSDTRQRVHELIDLLPETQLSGLVQFLETIVDPVTTALRNAPLDDEPEMDEEKTAVSKARTWLHDNGGKGIPHAEAMRRLGLE
ncbi:MAG: hypothetical protein ABI995_08795 [Acidobacteriota bacterium]